jgi:hypothetical protein
VKEGGNRLWLKEVLQREVQGRKGVERGRKGRTTATTIAWERMKEEGQCRSRKSGQGRTSLFFLRGVGLK